MARGAAPVMGVSQGRVGRTAGGAPVVFLSRSASPSVISVSPPYSYSCLRDKSRGSAAPPVIAAIRTVEFIDELDV